MNAIQNFAFEEHLVRVIDREGDPWFVGVDICKALELVKPENAISSLDDDEKYTLTEGVLGTGTGPKARLVVSEPGVYRLVFRSRKPEAERFKRWLAHEVLPAIRKTGSYNTAPAEPAETSPEGRQRLALDLVREARLIHGRAAAARLWAEVGLPEIPPAKADNEPEACLEHLLDADAGHGNVRQLLAAAFAELDGAAARLAECGLRAGKGWFAVANTHPFIRKTFRPTRWQQPYRYLRRLEGAAEAKVMKYGSRVSRGIELPAFYADEEAI